MSTLLYLRANLKLPGKLSLILVGKADSGKSETGNSIIMECNKRLVLFNNYNSNDNKIYQRDELLDIVIELNNDDKKYTKRHFMELKNVFKPSKNIAMITVPINTQKPERTELNQTVGTMKSHQTISTQTEMQKSEIEVHTLDKKSPISETVRAIAHDKMIHERKHTETTDRKSSDDKKKRLAYPELDLILIGKSGSGKSATGNSILRQQEFKAHCKADSDERFPQYRTTIIDGRNVQVVECPGIIDTDIDKRGGVERVVRAIQNAVLANPEGYHAFLIVVAFGQRFYKQELDCIKILKHIFGQNVIKTHGIIVLSYGDTFKHHEVKEEVTMKKYCEKQTGPLKELLMELILDAKNKENWSDILNNIKNVIKELLNEINKKLETKEILGLLKLNMVETIRYIEYCAKTYEMSDELFKEVEIEF
ncbi:GTPase IMAP family member 8-like [Physella acuta]|uniref:GTPase IMAP family member 8-like n=1 Tax=Physella acuta TaxID=109671 RepID=UPI0027DB4870|nr:GTPase IMAP family member 8-like [Physella acuta]